MQPAAIKTKATISLKTGVLAIGLTASVGLFAFSLWYRSAAKDISSVTPATTSKTSAVTIDLSNEPLPPTSSLTDAEYSAKLAATQPLVPPADFINLTITSPSEGQIVNGTEPITATLIDPNHLATKVTFATFNDRYHYQVGTTGGCSATLPGWCGVPTLGLYPSGEYRYVATAINQQGQVVATKDVMVTVAHSCYYLAYQDMTLNAPTTSVEPGARATLTGSITNKMRGNCQNIYDLSANAVYFGSPNAGPSLLPEGWSAIFNPTSMNLRIGETKQFTMTVQVPATAKAGTHQVGATSQRVSTGFIVTKNAEVTVVAGSGGGGGRDPSVID